MKKIIDLEVAKRQAQETDKGTEFILFAKSIKGSNPEVNIRISAVSVESFDGFPLHHKFSLQINNPQKSMKDFKEPEPEETEKTESEETEENESNTN